MYGWYAYIVDNLVIVETLNKARTQKIITLPEKISVLLLTKDFKKLICASLFKSNSKNDGYDKEGEIGSEDEDSGNEVNGSATIFVLGNDFVIERRL